MRFKKVDCAIKAFDNQKTMTLLLNCPNLKIMFSDHEKVTFFTKRPSIVGDSFGYEKDEDLSNILYCGFNGNIPMQSEKALKKEMQQYADLRNVFVKQAQHGQLG